MKVLKGIVIIIYIILGASFGIMLIPEILNDLGMNTPPIYTNHYIDGLVAVSYTHLPLPTNREV